MAESSIRDYFDWEWWKILEINTNDSEVICEYALCYQIIHIQTAQMADF